MKRCHPQQNSIRGWSAPPPGRRGHRIWVRLPVRAMHEVMNGVRSATIAGLLFICAFPGKPAAQEAAVPVSGAEQSLTVTPDFGSDAWVDASQPIGLRLSRPLDIQNERLAIVIGRTDVSALFTVTPLVARYAASTLPLPSGETEVAVFVVTQGAPWQEVGRFPLRVRTRGGFHKREVKPGLTLTTNGQIAPEQGGDGTRRPPYQGVTFNPALRTTLVNDNGTVELQSNFLAVTKQAQALRFSNRGDGAPKFDLADYVIKGQNGPLTASAGHVSFGSSKHLINGIASRGMTAGLAIAKIAELSLAMMNGSSIVGWDNPVGFANDDHRIYGASLRVDALRERPGALLLDVSLLSAAQLPLSGFNDGEVNDREKNRGAGFHFTGKSPGDRLTLDAGYTVSRFENPFDPNLSDGFSVVEVRPETKGARFADLSLAILRGVSLTKTLKANLNATVRHERVDPLFRSLGASVQSNVLQNVLELSGGIGPLAVQTTHARSEDNLDDLESALKTFTRVSSANLVLPTGALFSGSKPTPFLPQLTWSLSRTHQFAKDVPVNADFTETHVPDQMSDNHSVDLQWAVGKWRAGYRYNISSQDNRQIGRENSDLENLAHNLGAGFSPLAWLDLAATMAFEGADNKEFSQRSDTRRIGANLDLRATKDLNLTGAYSKTWMYDDPRTSESDNDELSVELSQNFRLLRAAAERPSGRVFLRYMRQSATSVPFVETVRGDAASRRNWALNSGVSLNAF